MWHYPSAPQYLDCTLVKALFSVHMVFCVSPITRVMSQATDELQEKVVTILSLFSIGNKTALGTGEGELRAGWLCSMEDKLKGVFHEASLLSLLHSSRKFCSYL